MPSNETLGHALEKDGNKDQKAILTEAALALTKSECVDLIEGHDVGLRREDKESINRLIKLRINNVQSILPWKDVKFGDAVSNNW